VPTEHRFTYDEMERDLRSIFNGRGNVFYIDASELDVSNAGASSGASSAPSPGTAPGAAN
jgi:hypothetical protein